MPPSRSEEIRDAVLAAIAASGASGVMVSPRRAQPRRFVLSGPGVPAAITVYAWTLTFGGRVSLPDEYRIQMTSVTSPLPVAADEPTLLIGFEPRMNLFAGFDLARHRVFTTGSPSVQIDRNALGQAERDGLSFHRKSNAEIAVGIRPDLFLAYAAHAALLHRLGAKSNVLAGLAQAVRAVDAAIPPGAAGGPRQRLVAQVNRLARDAGFRRRVMFAYGEHCAVTRARLRLNEAAHILPVGAAGSTDEVSNGIALSPTYHRAFDAGLIYLDEHFIMRVNDERAAALRRDNALAGLEQFRRPLDRAILLPPDPRQRPPLDMIRRANRLRGIAAG